MHIVKLENFKMNHKKTRHYQNCPFFLGSCHTDYTSTQLNPVFSSLQRRGSLVKTQYCPGMGRNDGD